MTSWTCLLLTPDCFRVLRTGGLSLRVRPGGYSARQQALEPGAQAGGPQQERAQQAEGGAGGDEAEAPRADEGEARAAEVGGGQAARGDQDEGGGARQTGTAGDSLQANLVQTILILHIIKLFVVVVVVVILLLVVGVDLVLVLLLPQQRVEQCPRPAILGPDSVGAGPEVQLLLQPVHCVRAQAGGVRHQVTLTLTRTWSNDNSLFQLQVQLQVKKL